MGLFGSKEKPEDLMYQGMSLIDRNQPKGAIALFNKVLKQDSKNVSALLNKGLALNQIKKYTDAVTCFEKLLRLIPKMLKPLTTKVLQWLKWEIFKTHLNVTTKQ